MDAKEEERERWFEYVKKREGKRERVVTLTMWRKETDRKREQARAMLKRGADKSSKWRALWEEEGRGGGIVLDWSKGNEETTKMQRLWEQEEKRRESKGQRKRERE